MERLTTHHMQNWRRLRCTVCTATIVAYTSWDIVQSGGEGGVTVIDELVYHITECVSPVTNVKNGIRKKVFRSYLPPEVCSHCTSNGRLHR